MARTTDGRRRLRLHDSERSVARCCRCRGLLRGIETELEALREQNRLLRDSAVFFAELSERLNAQLREERARQPQMAE